MPPDVVDVKEPVEPGPDPVGSAAPTLIALIDATYPSLTPQERRAASYLRDHLAELAMYNSTEIASLSGVSKATISRLFRRFGFANADELREQLRTIRREGTPLARETAGSFTAHLEQEIDNLRTALAGLDLTAAATLIARASRVVVIGFRTSYPMALHLRQQLAQARDNVTLAPLPGQSIGEELASLGPDDVALVVGFRRRPQSFARMIATLETLPIRTILLTDVGGRRFAHDVDQLIVCPVHSTTAFDSYAAVTSLINLLASAVIGVDISAGRSRIAAIGARFDSLDELETPEVAQSNRRRPELPAC